VKEKLTAQHIEGFVNALIKKHFDAPAETPACHLEWWDMCCSSHKFVAIAAPRGHAKSTAITMSYTMACVLFRERQFVLLVSDTESQSSFFLNTIKRLIDIDPDIRKFFGVTKFEKETETDVIIEFDDGYQARIIAKGSEQKLRGINWNNKRPDLIVCDDMENDEIVMNQERREKFRNWFSSALMPCRSRDGIIRYVGTILHMDAQLERIMPKDWDKKAIHTDLCVKTSLQAQWYAAKYRAHSDDFKHILWPTFKDKEWLLAERAVYQSQGMLDKYAQEYLNVPIDETNSYFRRSDFLRRGKEDEPKRLNYYLSCDMAVTVKARADYTVFVVAGTDEEGKLHVLNVIRDRIDSLEIVNQIMALNKQYDFDFCVFEKGAITNSILPILNVRMHEDNNYVLIHTITPTQDKMSRAQSIRARMRAGGVKFDKDAEWFQPLELECMRFPRDLHDDQVDALSLLGMALDKFVEAPTKEELEQIDYELEMEEGGIYEVGRSLYTGY
jgi:predicted phage terminase large subunit-like protein